MASNIECTCILPICNSSDQLQAFKVNAIKRIIECAIARHDDDTRKSMQKLLDEHGEQASVNLHKNCYCSYTSKSHIGRYVAKKRKEGLIESEDVPAARVRRSQAVDFDFKNQCLFCAQICVPLDPKHPDRWDRVVQCERMGLKNSEPFKESVLLICDDRKDDWSQEVALRCHGTHDLSAAEAQYHVRCYDEFRKIPRNADTSTGLDDKVLQQVANKMFANRKKQTWTSLDLYDEYYKLGGVLTRKQMFSKLVKYLGDDLIVLNIQGCASVVGFREYVGTILKLSQIDTVDEDNDDLLARKITTECKSIMTSNHKYELTDFSHERTKETTSPTLLRLISKLVANGEVTKRSLSLSQSIQYNITKETNQTTLGLGIKLHHKFGSSELIHILHDHGYTVSYDEVLKFRKSAAMYVSDNVDTLHKVMGLSRNVGVIFGWYDNFDLFVSTPNGRRETHAMATEFQLHPAGIIETSCDVNSEMSALTIPRLTAKETKNVGKNRAVKIIHHAGPKKVLPPAINRTGTSYARISAQYSSLLVAQEKDMKWLNSLNQEQDVMEWNGFNNAISRDQSVPKPATIYKLGPLIDAPPSHPDTILTTLTYMQAALLDMGMSKVHLCMDMQLYAVTQQVCWYKTDEFKNVVVHPGGMHIIQSFLSCISKLMKGSGLETYVAAAYGGLTGIFNGKSWVKAMRAYRNVSTALLQRFLSVGERTFDELEEYMERARLHPTGRHWVDNFLLPTLLIHQFERAEREGDVALKEITLKRMMKYFFVAGHVQYARYLTQYLLEMNESEEEERVDLVCRHKEGYWNAVSADQFGEQTAIKIGKGSLKGMTLSPELVSEWIDAFPVTVHIADRLDGIYTTEESQQQSSQKQHKEELLHRRKLDAKDRAGIQTEVNKYPHPLEDARPYLFNPVSGQIASPDVNVADSQVLGDQLERNYISSLPGGFYNVISSPIRTMNSSEKQAKGTKNNPVIDLETIFLRLLLIGQQRQLELGPLFSYELCAVPPALIDEYSCLRKGNKSGLVKRLGVLEMNPDNPDMVIVDVSQLFYHIVWPFGGKPSDLVESIKERLNHYPNESKKVIVFDKYENISAKDHERKRRADEVVINYELSISSKLPKRDAIMKNKLNKRQLGSVLCTFDFGDGTTTDSSDDYVFGHDEADITMVSYVLDAANKGHKVVRVLSNDTDVFVLLVYWVHLSHLTCKVQMERWDGTILDIGATCLSLGGKCLELLGMHALSGCDTTSFPFGKGKISALKTMQNGTFPGLQEVLGETKSTNEEVVAAATTYILALYGQARAQSLEAARFNLFKLKKRNPKVSSLPPTSANFKQHALRAHLQVMLWKAANQHVPPVETSDITNFGWKFEDGLPVPVIDEGIPAPPELTEVIRCQCKAQDKKCGKETCSCHKDKLSCTSYCNCAGGGDCFNPHTTHQVIPDEENEVQALTTQEETVNEEEEEVPDALNVDEWV